MTINVALDGDTLVFAIKGNQEFTEWEKDAFTVLMNVEIDLLSPDAEIELTPGLKFTTGQLLGVLNE